MTKNGKSGSKPGKNALTDRRGAGSEFGRVGKKPPKKKSAFLPDTSSKITD
jgi:hypothetical protein